jgi:transmembrane sensor
MKDQKAKALLEKYEAGTCTPEEKKLVESWYIQESLSRADKPGEPDLDAVNQKTYAALQGLWQEVPGRSMRLWYFAAAAVVVVLVAAAVLFFPGSFGPVKESNTAKSELPDAPPGGNYATLTLDDGTAIALDQAKNGQITTQAGIKVTKTAEGEIVYETLGTAPTSNRGSIGYHTITTPKGGQYQVILPDGSKVWLNAESSLRYPTAFSGRTRDVTLKGEAYFEIKHALDKSGGVKTPFIVSTASQEVRVLGTHFNINAYEDEGVVKTTLLEGSVRVTPVGDYKINPVILKPNTQSVFNGQKLAVAAVDAETVVAWKNGLFQFNHTDLKTIVRQLSRWYNLDADYETLPNLHFNGTISRNVNASKVLNMLELTGNIKFTIKGNTIFVR